jgi:hypothetical protein
MSKELDDLAREYQRSKPTVIRKEMSIFQSSLSTEAASFLRSVEQECKRQKQPNLVLVAIIPEIQKINNQKTFV